MWLSTSGIIILLLILSINLTVGFLVITRNSKLAINRWFLVMTLGTTVWAASSVVSDSATGYTLAHYASNLAYGASFFGVSAAYMFSKIIYRNNLSKFDYWFFAVCCGLSVLYSTSLVYNLTTYTEYEIGPLYNLYLVSMVMVMLMVIYNFTMSIRKGDHTQRVQAQLILGGFLTMVVLALITNAIIPALMDTTETSKLGPLFSVFFVTAVAYGIIKHKLFDIRLVIARSLAYVLSLGVLFVGYAFLTSVIVEYLLGSQNTNPQVIAINSASLVVAVLIYQPIKRFFDRVTNQIFYRDAYDPQTFLDTLNQTFIENIELGILLRHTSKVIEENLKCDFALFGVFSEDQQETRLIGSAGRLKNDYHIEDLRSLLNNEDEKIIVFGETTLSTSRLETLLDKNRISLTVRLQSPYGKQEDTKAYLLLGAKKSGNSYSKQDLRIIGIIANELVIAIQNALRFEEIENFNMTLQKKVDGATNELRRTNSKLRDLDEAKDDFISMASHQLRTPLTSVKGYISMIKEGDAGKVTPTQKQMLEQAYFSSQRMVYLIADLLNVSRLRTGKFLIEAKPVNLVKVVEEEVEQLVEIAKSRDLKLDYEKPNNEQSIPHLMLDETKTRQIIMNFIDNAIYYTPAGGRITVKVIDKPSTVELRVEDEGMGVPKSEQPHLFTKFYRAANARKARPDGTGLGLFMAKKVIVAQHGSIIFESQEHKGSTFGFIFSKQKLAVTTDVKISDL